MATKTLGTGTTTGLTALQTGIGSPAADIAAINNIIKSQPGTGTYQVIEFGAYAQAGLLYLPGKRGVIALQNGDWVGVDVNGWPIVVSKFSIATGSAWSHS